MTSSDSLPLPVTLLTGFLGAGKTTLVNRILTERHGERIAVLVNEFGELGIDGQLVVSSADSLVELANGCVCCTVRGDLQKGLHDLLQARAGGLFRRGQALDRILIEASGLAAPGPIAQTLAIDPGLRASLRLDGILALAHAQNLPRQLQAHPEAVQQIAYADRVLINHADRATAIEIETCRASIRARNSLAEVLISEHAAIDVGPLLAIGTTREGDWNLDSSEDLGDHSHASDVTSVALRSGAPMDLAKLKIWLQFLGTRRTHELFRLKGILRCTGRSERVVVQGMYEWLELGPGDGLAPDESALVLIGRDLDHEELQRGWRACVDA
ncbi:MAG: G3E family GTPase [Candidatus Paceibacteria bacterium]|jgi:G3E family GTPase